MSPLLPLGLWVPIVDGDPLASDMYERSYASDRSRVRRQARGQKQIAGPAEKLLLMTPSRDALFVWRRHRFRQDGEVGVECSVFRNEGSMLASVLIAAADLLADQRWPGVRHFTFVDERKVRGNPPGNCFRRAGWRDTGRRSSERDLIVLERAAPAVSGIEGEETWESSSCEQSTKNW